MRPTKEKRAVVPFENQCKKFVTPTRVFDLQYFAFYNARFKKMYESLKEAALQKWGKDIKLIRLNQLMDHPDQEVCVIGVLLKVMKQQKSVLREVSEDLELIPEAEKDKYIDDTDYLSLQDDTEACALQGGPDVSTHVTGVMVAVLGREHDNGNRFIVSDYCYSSLAPQVSPTYPGEDRLVMLVSDLGFSLNTDGKITSAREALLDFLTGFLDETLAKRARSVVRVIIAGNSLAPDSRKQEQDLEALDCAGDDEWNRKERAYTIEAVRSLDKFLHEIAKVIPVDLMPGENDAATHMMPQQPIHPKILPKSSSLKGLFRVTNPYSSSIGGLTFTGTSGRVIKSIQEVSSLDEPVEILESTLKWRHLIPTAPDTVWTCPFKEDDPFVIDSHPHVYFAGSQKSFNTKVASIIGRRTRIIAVPSFRTTQTAVMVNLRNLSCEVVAFN